VLAARCSLLTAFAACTAPAPPPSRRHATELFFPIEHAQPLPAPAGSILGWTMNTIHWGAACSPVPSAPPRKSFAAAFRVPTSVCPFDGREMGIAGREPLTREQAACPALAQRLGMVCQALLMYSQWFPQLKGLERVLGRRKGCEIPEQAAAGGQGQD
jgi:hypothetical protein